MCQFKITCQCRTCLLALPTWWSCVVATSHFPILSQLIFILWDSHQNKGSVVLCTHIHWAVGEKIMLADAHLEFLVPIIGNARGEWTCHSPVSCSSDAGCCGLSLALSAAPWLLPQPLSVSLALPLQSRQSASQSTLAIACLWCPWAHWHPFGGTGSHCDVESECRDDSGGQDGGQGQGQQLSHVQG